MSTRETDFFFFRRDKRRGVSPDQRFCGTHNYFLISDYQEKETVDFTPSASFGDRKDEKKSKHHASNQKAQGR
jgi:hypothetical protein